MLLQAQQQRKSKVMDSPALSCGCHYLKTPCSVWENILPIPLFPVIYQILLAIDFKGATTYSDYPNLVDFEVSRHATLRFCIVLAVTGSPTAFSADFRIEERTRR